MGAPGAAPEAANPWDSAINQPEPSAGWDAAQNDPSAGDINDTADLPDDTSFDDTSFDDI
jgi:hypothetical protein